MGAVAAGLEQREAHRVFAGQESAAREAVSVAGDPVTLPTTFDVEMVGRADTLRDKSRHVIAASVSHARVKDANAIKFRERSNP